MTLPVRGQFLAPENNPLGHFEVLLLNPSDVPAVTEEMGKIPVEVRDGLFGDFAIRAATEDWPEIAKVVQGDIQVIGRDTPSLG